MIVPSIEIIDIETEEILLLKEPSPLAVDLHYSPDGKWIELTNMKSLNITEVMIINRDDPFDIVVYNISDKSEQNAPSWSPDGKSIAYLSNERGWRQVVIQEFQGEEQIFLDLEKDEEVPEYEKVVWNPNSDIVYYLISKHGPTTMHSHPISESRGQAFPFPKGTLASIKIRKDGKFISVLHSSMVSPYGVYLYEIGSKNVSLLTPRECNFDLSLLKNPKSVWYKSFDSRKIHAWYMPALSAKEPYPANIYSHGSPWNQTRDSWLDGLFFRISSLKGFGTLGPNFRGSLGYGTEFEYLDIGDIGGGDLEDIIHGAEWLKNQPEIDNTKVGIFGGSYGGYMTLIALTKKPEVFATGISMTPIVDWVEMHKLSDVGFKLMSTTLMGGPPRKKYKDLYIDRSPITHVSNIKAPVLIMAGKTDSRVPWPPIEKFINKLKEMNHPHELAIEEKAGHVSAILNHNEIIPIATKMMEFLKKTLS